MEQAAKDIQYLSNKKGHFEKTRSRVIVEQAVSLTVNGAVWLTFMCTPVDLEEMAIGFLFNEGIISSPTEIASLRVCENQENVDVWLTVNVEKPTYWRRTSGCTGGVTSADPEKEIHLQQNDLYLPARQVHHLIAQLFDVQGLYELTGGVHTSALSDGEQIVAVADDIGRHNTLDKIAGRCLLKGLNPERRVLLTTGRISSEMLQKAARIGAPILISRTSPSSLSIELAEKWGITLIGYARRDRFNLYTHHHRIIESEIISERREPE